MSLFNTKSPKEGDIKLVERYLLIPRTLHGVTKKGRVKLYKRYERNYANYDAADWECWYDYCWEEQVEYITFP